ncbi:hypothetical protein CCHR01_17940 [Colletotrichum chrysophilum]|uniref:Uncharacterized protein n=1 Tax=Colletotrichum chrysophilum TaxID=1836956 RepID=A0AAD9EC03_9PEZI|nr:hypothetical protein CCHR01_17940 [Colletotrichum chrysophilum]
MNASSLTSCEHSHPALLTRSERSTRPSAERLCRQHIHRPGEPWRACAPSDPSPPCRQFL